ncbi:MAG: 30S ribosomal protein S9, partial [Parcubacteria group bacterium]|nr:30S ribosomal protein S9 [Parcubacteria group bacterium]
MVQKETKKETKKADRYLEGVGRRKTATARVRLWLASPKTERKFLVNEKSVEEYFRDPELQRVAKECLEKAGTEDSFSVKVLTRGGGLPSQAEAIRHGIARALVEHNPELRSRLRALGFLTRDPRMRERKKFGLHRARRATQWR